MITNLYIIWDFFNTVCVSILDLLSDFVKMFKLLNVCMLTLAMLNHLATTTDLSICSKSYKDKNIGQLLSIMVCKH